MFRRTVFFSGIFCLLQFFISSVSVADEIRPGYLELKESSKNIFSVIWKVPAKGDKKLALIFFNVGVEIGQLLFVLSVLSFGWMLHRMKQPVLLERAETVAVYIIGSLSSFWLFTRISLF